MPAFVDDDSPWVASREELSPPATYRQLLNRIGVDPSAPLDVVRRAVADWLTANEAPPSLIESLRARNVLPLTTA